MTKWHGGKGSARRPEDRKKLDENWDRIFGQKRKQQEKQNETEKDRS
jgi:hypothetical protein